MARLLTYAPKDTWIHRLSGVTKMLFFILWSVVGMLTYDTRILVVMLLFSLVVFKVSKTEWKQVGTVNKEGSYKDEVAKRLVERRGMC